LHTEVQWTDIAPLLDEFQKDPKLITVGVRRQAFRIAAGGEVPVLLNMLMSALVLEVVRDMIYPKLKQTFYSIYRKLPSLTGTGRAYPMRITIVDADQHISYDFGEGLTDAELEQALGSIPTHFAGLKLAGDTHVIFTFDPKTRRWT